MSNDLTILEQNYREILNSVEGYKEAAEIADNNTLKTTFRAKQTQREHLLSLFETRIRDLDLNYDLNNTTTIAAEAHQGFMKLRAAVSNDNKAVLSELERGEKHLIDELEAATQKNVQPETSALLNQALTQTRQDLTDVQQLQNSANLAA